MQLTNKKIGIWGLGVVGKSAVRYLHARNAQLQVLDNRTLTADEQEFLSQHQTSWVTPDALIPFLEQNDNIVPSPGIDLRPYAAYQSKWLSELDIFRDAYKNPIIAITGSVGKTSVTHLLSTLLHTHYRVATGGNIGTAMLDLLTNPSDIAILEVSSFQLDLCRSFAPDLAIWTNFYANHLDRHGSESDYFKAKYKIFAQQKEGQKALMPLNVYQQICAFAPFVKFGANKPYLFCVNKPTDTELEKLADSTLFYIDNGYIIKRASNREEKLIAISKLPDASFIENWLLICAALTILNVPLTTLSTLKNNLALPEHRLEKVATINGVTFYNDSKSTTPQSTLAAIAQLQKAPIHLFIGGMSKGIDRTPLIESLKGRVKQIYCFGKEAEQLYAVSTHAAIPAHCSTTLEEAFALATTQIMPGDIVLLSPAGASFDLFKDYQERGNRFKELVNRLSP